MSSMSGMFNGTAYGIINFLTSSAIFLVNIPFIITSLIFAHRPSTCVTTHVENFSFNLSVWLQIDAYFKILIIVILLANIVFLFQDWNSSQSCLQKEGWKVVAFFGLFTIIWTICGSVLFWGRLSPSGVCQGQIPVYTNVLLSINFAIFCCYCFLAYTLFKNQR